MSSDHGEPSFERTLAELETRVKALEAGELPLDEALRLYEEGVQLARTCHELLDAADQRVARLSRGQAGIEEHPLPEPPGSDGAPGADPP